jgi:pimeloyl-ACP methyl ester carboxylesterase
MPPTNRCKIQLIWGTHTADILSYHPPSYLSGVVYVAAVPYMKVIAFTGAAKIKELSPGLFSTTDVNAFQKAVLCFVSFLTYKHEAVSYRLKKALIGDMIEQPRAIAARAVTRAQDEKAILNAGKKGLLRALVVSGREDSQPKGEVVKALGEWKDLKVVEIEDCGHMLFAEQPDEFREIMLAWIEKGDHGR